MKKLTLILLLISILSYGQIIVDKKLGEIDIRTLSDKYITIELDELFSHSLVTSQYTIPLKRGRQKRWNVFDKGNAIALVGKVDILNYFSKYGWKLVSTDVSNDGSFTNFYDGSNVAYTTTMTSTSLLLVRE
tara:strand:- start:795 stop:1190 length:396 start_codon:yes stop_codon:yes gene_type:complete